MKKYVLIASTLTVLFVIYLCLSSNTSFYPTLPFDGGSKKGVVDKLEKGDGQLVELAENNGFHWFGFKGNQQAGRAALIKEMEYRGLKYDSYDGSGIFFFKNDEQIIVTGTIWTRDYVLYQVPAGSY
ncbi:hypothetical protein [Paenibacillus sp. GYB003]|uniref:hypothetical protein n=1 Tax=Paenibacillus sp. GYB003 TaxID=2994392 RepID=UPI002F962E14